MGESCNKCLCALLYVFFAITLNQNDGYLDEMAIPSGYSIWVVNSLGFKNRGAA